MFFNEKKVINNKGQCNNQTSFCIIPQYAPRSDIAVYKGLHKPKLNH